MATKEVIEARVVSINGVLERMWSEYDAMPARLWTDAITLNALYALRRDLQERLSKGDYEKPKRAPAPRMRRGAPKPKVSKNGRRARAADKRG